jgi:hypothetical protein
VIGFRAEGCRREYQLTISGCYKKAVQATVEKMRREKIKEKAKSKKKK